MREVVTAVWSARMSLAAGSLVLAVSACGNMDLPAPARNPPIVLPVMINQNGRVITVRAAKPCGHRPALVARQYPHRVTLRLVNRDVSNCHVEAAGVTSVSVTLARPLGNRQLIQALNGKPIKYNIGHIRRRVKPSTPPGTLRATRGSSPPNTRSVIPPEFRRACGHPGARVRVRKVPVTISHAACDLTGVMITYQDYGGAFVPSGSGEVGNSSGFTLTVHPGTLDVTVNATGVPGND